MQKYSIKLLLNTRKKNKQGLSPIYIRITINRKTSYISTGIYLNVKNWDEKTEQVKDSHPLASVWNPDLTNRKSELTRTLVDNHIKGDSISAIDLKRGAINKAGRHNIFDFIEQYKEDVKHRRSESTLENYSKWARNLQLFHGSKSLDFEDIDTTYLTRYENHLRERVSPNYVFAVFRGLHTFFNAARKKKLITCYPFTEYEPLIYESPKKDYLNLAELELLEGYVDKCENKILRQVGVYYLLGCYSGLRVSDWKVFKVSEHVVDNRLKLRAKKNGEWVTMPISKPLQRTLGRVQAIKLTVSTGTMNEKLKIIAKSLGIKKRLSTHTGRHTFAITMCADRGISSETTAELMGIEVETCISSYYRVTNKKIDKEAMKAWDGLA